MGDVYIYGFVCPIENEVMYVGKTKNIKQRTYQHLMESSRKKRTPKEIWLSELLSAGLSPSLIVLEICQSEDWQDREAYWINYYRSLNPNLKNSIVPDIEMIRLDSEHSTLLQRIAKKDKRSAINQLLFLIDIRAQEMGLVQAPIAGKRKRVKPE